MVHTWACHRATRKSLDDLDHQGSMTRHPKPIPMLGAKAFEVRSADGLEAVFYDKHAALEYAAELKSIGARSVTVEPAESSALGVHNPAPEDFAAGVIANHVRTAIVELKRAHHYATQFSGVRFREVAGSISQHAARAGEYAAYSGRPLEQWHAERADELAVPSIAAAFDAQFQATTELLATPEEELEDEGPAQNPPRRWPSSQVQSLLFDTEYWTATEAKRWAKDHGFKYGDVDTTDRYHHLRQFDPIHGRPCRTVIFAFSKDEAALIKARVCSG